MESKNNYRNMKIQLVDWRGGFGKLTDNVRDYFESKYYLREGTDVGGETYFEVECDTTVFANMIMELRERFDIMFTGNYMAIDVKGWKFRLR